VQARRRSGRLLQRLSWHPQFVKAFTAVSGAEPRLADLHVTMAAVLTAHALNVGYAPIVQTGAPARSRARVSRPPGRSSQEGTRCESGTAPQR